MSASLQNGAWCWLAGMRVDADGCPRGYAAPGSGLRGLDALANAGEDGNWFGVVTDNGRKDGNPVVQQDGPNQGYLVSPSSLVDHSIADLGDPARYVDAEEVPYVSIPSDMLAGSHGGPLHVGDLAVVFYRGKAVAGIVADVGPRGKYGEASIAMAAAHGIPSSPRNGGCSSGVLYVVFPGSAATPAWPRSNEEIAEAALALFASWGGADFAARLAKSM
jgi:hypothetical protein